MHQLDEALFERAIHWASQREGEAEVLAARKAFEEATGAITHSDPDYESRMLHFFESWLCATRGDDPALIARFAAEAAPEQAAQRQLAGWQRSHRSLFAFEGFQAEGGVLRDLLLQGRYRFMPAPRDRELALGDRFDARLIAGEEGLWLSPGRVYHARATFDALDKLLAGPGLPALSHTQLLDGLLRMRSRFLRFASIRPEHVFCLDGFAEQAFAAPWAKPAHRASHQRD
jgi:hypothetical protein